MPDITKAAAGTFCWVQLETTDIPAAKKFYGGLFGWGIADVPMGGGPYSVAALGDKQVGGMTILSEQAQAMGTRPMWLSYVAVDDAAAGAKKIASLGADTDASAERARGLGGTVVNPPTDIPAVGRFAVIADPQGATFSVIKFLPPQK